MSRVCAVLLVLSLVMASAVTFLPVRAGYGIAQTISVPGDYSTIAEVIGNAVNGDAAVFEVYGRKLNVSLTVALPENKGDFLTLAFKLKIEDSNEYAISRREASVLDYYLVYGCVLDYARDRTIDTLWRTWGDSNNETHLTEAKSIFPHIYDAVLAQSEDTYYGSIVLPKLLDGAHNVTVWVRAEQDFLSTWSNIWAAFSKTVTFTLDTSVPVISILSPQNTVYNESSLPLNFSINEKLTAITYSMDGKENMTIAGNTTLTGLPNGHHNVTVYATDEAGNIGASEITQFSIAVSESFPTTAIAIAFVIVAVAASATLLFYFKKREKARLHQ